MTEFFYELTQGLGSFFFGRSTFEVLRDLFDIGLVTVIIYWGLVILKGTRAMQMALGLVLIFIAYLGARRFGLITIYQMLDSLVTYSVLVVVVIFQADIRRALMRVGRGPLFRGARTARETAVIEEVIKSAKDLAAKRIGALIVFERDAELGEFIESGSELDAEVSKELLYSIFIPSFENPLHDGAVIIRDGRIWKAGTFLPLAGGAHDPTMGTRHRAALGISEETDAVVVVVSEERGAVSLCFNGNIVRNLDAESLREALFGLFYRQKDRPQRNSKVDSRSQTLKDVAPMGKEDTTERSSLAPAASNADDTV